MTKQRSVGVGHYARGGAVLGKQSEFIKTPDRFRGEQTDPNTFGKGQGKANPSPKNKQIKKV